MKNLNEWKLWLQEHEDLFRDLVRTYLGVGLFVKGLYFMSHRTELKELLENMDNLVFAQAALAHYIIPVHIVGGLLLAIGLLTRIAALVQVPILFGAAVYVYLPKMELIEPRQNMEFTLLVLFLLALLVAYGAGRFSVDHLLWKKEQTRIPAHSAA
jgi:uncharacterized membrane protein YphA (DoxX/SURF4 family)